MTHEIIERQMAAEAALLRGLQENAPNLSELRANAARWDLVLAVAARAAAESGSPAEESDG